MIENKSLPSIKIRNIVITDLSGSENKDIHDKSSSRLHELGKQPLLWYNGILISHDTIKSFYIDTTKHIPTLKVYFHDPTSSMLDKCMAVDNTVISVYIDSRTKDSSMKPTLQNLRMDFKIVHYAYMEDSDLFFVQGVPDIDDYYIQKIKNYDNKTSYEVLKTVASECKLGYRSNISNTADKMTWQNLNLETYDFVRDVTKHAYKSENSFFVSFVDTNYFINMIDVEKAMRQSLDQDGVYTYGNESFGSDKMEIDKLYIMNSSAMQSKYNNSYESYEYLNRSTDISISEGYRKNIHYYDKNGNWDQSAGTMCRFSLETNTQGKGIVLKSFPEDTKDDGFYKKNSKNVYSTPIDTDNVHTNYNFAEYLNSYNISETDKMLIKVTMREPNFNFYKYQKILTYIMTVKFTNEKAEVNERLSGGWLIKAINYYYDSNGIKQELIMSRRELSTGDLTF